MSEDAADTETYALRSKDLSEITPPDINYLPPMPRSYRPRIGMIGTGGISNSHLDAYRTAGWEVAALWNRTPAKAEEKAAEYCPSARVETDFQAILDNSEIDVVDITLPTEIRAPVIEAALKAGKHVLSQKPFVSDLETGQALVQLAKDHGVKLAVNQNGRWSPHMAWMREACKSGLIGDIISMHVAIHWDHGWTAGTPFDEVEDLILYDFGIHWFDFISSIIGSRAETVFSTASQAASQENKAPLLAQAMITMDKGQASLIFDGSTQHGPSDTTYIAGTAGSIHSQGSDLGQQKITVTTAEGISQPSLHGAWFNDGFRGAMGELLCAIEENRQPQNAAANILPSLALTFAAVQSRHSGQPVAIKRDL